MMPQEAQMQCVAGTVLRDFLFFLFFMKKDNLAKNYIYIIKKIFKN